MSNLFKNTEWERSHPWLAGALNGAIGAIAAFVAYSFTSDSPASRGLVVAAFVGVTIGLVRALMLKNRP